VPRFFVPAGHLAGGRARLDGDNAAHLARSLRATPGEHVVVVDDAGMEHGVRLLSVSAAVVEGEVEWSRPVSGEPGLEVHVVQAVAKDGMDELVEALTEVGVAAVWPVLTRRTVARPDARRAAHRVARWEAIARNAAGLAGRGRVPVVHPVRELHEVPALLPDGTRLLACTLDGATPLASLSPPPHAGDRIALVIGPEGGLDAADLSVLQTAGAAPVHLGPRLLRARLAGVVAVSALLAGAGEMRDAPAGWAVPETVPS